LVPVDFSRCSFEGLKYAVQFARNFAAKVILLHVIDIAPTLTADRFGLYEVSRYASLFEAEARKRMPSFLRPAKVSGVRFETKVVRGRSAGTIGAVAKECQADLIILATHGRTGLGRVLLGSTAEVVVRYAPCPVLVVPSHPMERKKRLGAKINQSKPTGQRRGAGARQRSER
jgi:nucleotide-binding universal stress UspA family protein